MNLILWGVVLWLAGKIAKVKGLETIGKVVAVIGLIGFGLTFVGVHLPFIS